MRGLKNEDMASFMNSHLGREGEWGGDSIRETVCRVFHISQLKKK